MAGGKKGGFSFADCEAALCRLLYTKELWSCHGVGFSPLFKAKTTYMKGAHGINPWAISPCMVVSKADFSRGNVSR